jgi:hypothetical protein
VLAEQAIALTDDMQDRLNNEVANLRAMHVKEQLATQAKLSSLEADLAAFQEMATQIGGVNEASAAVHRFSSAVLNLENALHAGAPLQNDAAAVAKYANSDPLVNAVLSSLPEALLKQGAPSAEELKARFNVVRSELRKVAMAPEALPPVLGQVVGSVLAKFYWQPTGPISGDGAEEILSRAAFHLDNNDIKTAVTELNQIKDPISIALLQDWKTKAENRLTADQAGKFMLFV